ncbi:MAG TPA: hypothetical protein VHK65_01210 [Candidatus Dormibacteraeota bacterium]|nr:hypothetical protein [Candidatus Dormibacteraeota bacterium]
MTSVVAYWGPHGGSYFLGGNSALQLSYELAPALVSGGWCILALHSRGYRHAVLLGAAAGLLGAGLICVYWAVAILTGLDFGLAAVGALLWDLTAPVLALVLPLKGIRVPVRKPAAGLGWYGAAAVILFLAIAVPTIRLEQCGPALGLPESPRQFVLCTP